MKEPSDKNFRIYSFDDSTLSSGIMDEVIFKEKKFSSSSKNNPFKLPPILDAKILEEDKANKKVKKKFLSTQPLHRKITESHHSKLMKSDVLKSIPSLPIPSSVYKSEISSFTNDPEFLKAVATGEKVRSMENTSSFIKSRRETFLIQYMIGIKKDEMIKMDTTEKKEEKRLDYAEKMLEEDAKKFNNFLKCTDREAVDATKQAEVETKMKLEKVAKIKKIHVQISSIKSEITKFEDILVEYEEYGKFLFKLSPLYWQQEQLENLEKKKRFKTLSGAKSMMSPVPEKRIKERGGRPSKSRKSSVGIFPRMSVTSAHRKRLLSVEKKEMEAQIISDLESSNSTITVASRESVFSQHVSSIFSQLYDEEDDDDATLGLYFSHPQQLLDIFINWEEMNLTVIQKNQEIEEALEDIRAHYDQVKKILDGEVEILNEQIEILEIQTKNEIQMAEDFEIKSKLFSMGEFDDSSQDAMLNELNTLVEQVYENIFGPNNVNLSTLQMMAAIENNLEEQLQKIDSLPYLEVERAVKLRDRQRRTDIRQLKLKEQQDMQLKKMEKTIEKIMALPQKIYGRKLIFRSNPPQLKYGYGKTARQTREEEEYNYFFT